MIERRRIQQPHETKTGQERWLVSYADFMTLLFAFFVMMYSVSQVSEQKYQVLSETLATVFEGKVPNVSEIEQLREHAAITPDVEALAANLYRHLTEFVDPDQITVVATQDWLDIELNANLLFASASADPSTDAKIVLAEVAKQLAPMGNAIEVAGHTDNIPINSGGFSSNWELSSARATSVVQLLANNGVAPTRLAAVGYGEFRPLADNQTDEGRAQNRRVVLRMGTADIEYRDEEPDDATEEPEGTNNPDSETRPKEPRLEPVRLENGGLLFSSNPDLPRNGHNIESN